MRVADFLLIAYSHEACDESYLKAKGSREICKIQKLVGESKLKFHWYHLSLKFYGLEFIIETGFVKNFSISLSFQELKKMKRTANGCLGYCAFLFA